MNRVLFILRRGKSSLQRELEKYFAIVERGKEIMASHLKEKIIKNILPIRPERRYERRFTRYKLPKLIPNKISLA